MFDFSRVHWLYGPVLCVSFAGLVSGATDLSSYRGFQFGMSVTAAEKQTDTQPADVKVVHSSPDLIQEINWQPHPAFTAPDDSVQRAVLSFFNGKLYSITVTYERYRIEGMTAEDLVEAISLTYGAATRPEAQIPFHSNYGEVAPVIARWEEPEYSYDLVRADDQSSFAMVLYSKPMNALAQASIGEALRLEALDAPRLERERQKKRDDDNRAVQEKARAANTLSFKP